MPFLILSNKTKQQDNSHFLLQLLIEIVAKQNVGVHEYSSITAARKVATKHVNDALLIHQNNSSLSFINLLQLRSIIKKRRIKWLVLFNYNQAYSFSAQQLLVVNDAAKWNSKKAISSSVKMAVASNAAKQNLIANHQIPEQNIEVIPFAIDERFAAIDWPEQQSQKMQYTQGKEFFMCNAQSKTYDTLMDLLKAFSTFKKWQHSNMKLLIYGSIFFAQKEEWQEKLNTYKYRDDIVLLRELEVNNHAALLASAYAFIHTPLYDEDVMPLLQAMSCGTPSISFLTESAKEYAEEAAIWIAANHYEQFGEKMILLYKDESLRNSLIERGKQQGKIYTKEKAMQLLQSALPLHPFG